MRTLPMLEAPRRVLQEEDEQPRAVLADLDCGDAVAVALADLAPAGVALDDEVAPLQRRAHAGPPIARRSSAPAPVASTS